MCFIETVKLGNIVKISKPLALEVVKEKLQVIPFISKVIEPVDQKFNSDLQVVLNDNYKIFIDIKAYDEIYPRHIKELVKIKEAQSSKNYLVLVTSYVSEAGHNLCFENGIGYFDLSGNCLFLSDSIYLSEKGNKNNNKSKKTKNDIFNPKSLVSSKILRFLLVNKHKPFKLKTLSKEVDCSIGQVSKVKEALYDKDMAEFSSEGIELSNIPSMMNEWAKEYSKKEKNEILCYTVDSLSDFEYSLKSMKETQNIDYFLTALAGGARYAPVVRYNKVHVYIPSHQIKLALNYLNCKEVTDGANLVILPFDEDIYVYDSKIINDLSIVSPVQVYLDCMQVNGRGEEMAEEILRKELI